MKEAVTKSKMAAPMRVNLSCPFAHYKANFSHYKLKLARVQHKRCKETHTPTHRVHVCEKYGTHSPRNQQKVFCRVKLISNMSNSTAASCRPPSIGWCNTRTYTTESQNKSTFKKRLESGPGLGHFIAGSLSQENMNSQLLQTNANQPGDTVPYLTSDVSHGKNRNGM